MMIYLNKSCYFCEIIRIFVISIINQIYSIAEHMNKIQLVILGLTASNNPPNSYAIILKEVGGNRTLPIIIGPFEAQAIALELEGATPSRPMTHDLIKILIYETNINLTEVLLCDFNDGIFYARLIFEDDEIEIDCRPSDAIAIALRCKAPIYVNEDILEETGLMFQIEKEKENESFEPIIEQMSLSKTKLEVLNQRLKKAIESENYEVAAKIRDEIKNILESQ